VRDDERQRILMLRTHVNEMNVESIDLGDELRQRRSAYISSKPNITPVYPFKDDGVREADVGKHSCRPTTCPS
jgi:hypothetical protein